MNWSFRTKLTALVLGLTIAAILGPAIFFLNLYTRDKLAYVYDAELSNTIQVSSYLRRAVSLARDISTDKAKESQELIALFDDICGSSPKTTVSKHFEKYFTDLNLIPERWLAAPELQALCVNPPSRHLFIEAKGSFAVPYLFVAFPMQRVAAVSLDGMGLTGVTTMILEAGAQPKVAWSDVGAQAAPLLARLRIQDKELHDMAGRAVTLNLPSALKLGSDGIAKVAPMDEPYAIVSISSRSEVLAPVYYVLSQSLFFAGGILFLALFIGKVSSGLLTRPLNELQLAADRIGAGNFTDKMALGDSTGDEFTQVKRAFNTMSEKIVRLLEDTKHKAKMESEIALTQKVQQMLLPKPHLTLAGHEIFSSVQMAARCGGDWWGSATVKTPSGGTLILLLVGDVMGHGVASALVTASAQGGLAMFASWLESQPQIAEDPRLVLKHFNRAIFETSGGSIHMTFFAAVIDPANGQLYCSNAGHNLPYLIEPSAEGVPKVTAIGPPGVALGLKRETEYPDTMSYPWAPGTQLFLYTDGLIDCPKGEDLVFRRKDMVLALRKLAKLKGRELIDSLLKERAKVTAGLPQEDDITLVVCVAPEVTA